MKKIIIILLLFLLCSCSANVNFDFKEDKIESSIIADFNITDYYDNISTYEVDSNLDASSKEKNLLDYKDSIIIPAFKDNNFNKYIELSFKKDNYNYKADYRYEYDYNNFKDNYFFNCFENFDFNEDNNYYNVRLSGKYNCTLGYKLNISASKGISNSNSLDESSILFSSNKERDLSPTIL